MSCISCRCVVGMCLQQEIRMNHVYMTVSVEEDSDSCDCTVQSIGFTSLRFNGVESVECLLCYMFLNHGLKI